MNLLDFIFPKKCLGCGRKGNYICPFCVSKVAKPKLVCAECKRASIDGFTHTKCQRKLGLNGLFPLWKYEGVVRKAILALKYKYATEIVVELQDYVVTELQEKKVILGVENVLIPIPLHWYRENYRGFNQSGLLGESIAGAMKWKFARNLLVKRNHSPSQVSLKKENRIKNIKGSFSITSVYKLQSTNYLLFDDVYTTGSTLREATKVLKRAGAKSVWGLTIAT